ncbi:MAG TPA: hypothetical protein VHK26_00255 [Methyloceanibacter sp.]|jgi:hypothetical protein|nr:hypothetical protein [Methyloceanibacter sp.]
MEKKRIKLGPLDTAGSVAAENRWVYRQLKAGAMEPNLAMKMSQILMNQRGMVETSDVENKITALEKKLTDLLNKGAGSNVVRFRKSGGFDI